MDRVDHLNKVLAAAYHALASSSRAGGSLKSYYEGVAFGLYEGLRMSGYKLMPWKDQKGLWLLEMAGRAA